MHFYTVQLLIILYAVLAAYRDQPLNLYQRSYIAINAPSVKQAHRFNFCLAFLVCLGFALLLTDWIASPFAFICCGLWYWIVFDMWINRLTNQPIFYVGHTSTIDKWLNKHLGKYAGLRKVQVSIVVIVFLNVLYYFL